MRRTITVNVHQHTKVYRLQMFTNIVTQVFRSTKLCALQNLSMFTNVHKSSDRLSFAPDKICQCSPAYTSLQVNWALRRTKPVNVHQHSQVCRSTELCVGQKLTTFTNILKWPGPLVVMQALSVAHRKGSTSREGDTGTPPLPHPLPLSLVSHTSDINTGSLAATKPAAWR